MGCAVESTTMPVTCVVLVDEGHGGGSGNTGDRQAGLDCRLKAVGKHDHVIGSGRHATDRVGSIGLRDDRELRLNIAFRIEGDRCSSDRVAARVSNLSRDGVAAREAIQLALRTIVIEVSFPPAY